MLSHVEEPVDRFARLVEIVARLRAEGGCPWDRAQTPQTLRPYLLEEAYEALDAIDSGDDASLRKELGDVLFLIVMLSQMADERGAFTVDDVVEAVSSKMIRRHPHVFDPHHDSSDDEGGIGAWEARKAKERKPDASALDGVPKAMPALLRAHRISEKAGAVGFDWPDAPSVRKKVAEELDELDEAMAAGDAQAIGEELGDVLFTLVNLGRHLPVGAEAALRVATERFEQRFRALEDELRAQGRRVSDSSAQELEPLWRSLKPSEAP